MGISANDGKPGILSGRWLNLHNATDRVPYTPIPIGSHPIRQSGCENFEISSSTAHTGYWDSDEVAGIIGRLR